MFFVCDICACVVCVYRCDQVCIGVRGQLLEQFRLLGFDMSWVTMKYSFWGLIFKVII